MNLKLISIGLLALTLSFKLSAIEKTTPAKLVSAWTSKAEAEKIVASYTKEEIDCGLKFGPYHLSQHVKLCKEFLNKELCGPEEDIFKSLQDKKIDVAQPILRSLIELDHHTKNHAKLYDKFLNHPKQHVIDNALRRLQEVEKISDDDTMIILNELDKDQINEEMINKLFANSPQIYEKPNVEFFGSSSDAAPLDSEEADACEISDSKFGIGVLATASEEARIKCMKEFAGKKNLQCDIKTSEFSSKKESCDVKVVFAPKFLKDLKSCAMEELKEGINLVAGKKAIDSTSKINNSPKKKAVSPNMDNKTDPTTKNTTR